MATHLCPPFATNSIYIPKNSPNASHLASITSNPSFNSKQLISIPNYAIAFRQISSYNNRRGKVPHDIFPTSFAAKHTHLPY